MIFIPARLNGPPDSANGGYTCGLVAQALDADCAEVSLRSPPPLEQPLEVSLDGEAATVSHGETVVAHGRAVALELEAGSAVAPDEAAAAARGGYERWAVAHPFPTCVVCGPDRGVGDGMRIFPGRLDDRRFAAGWTPDASLAGRDGVVRGECVWAALDCPTSAPVANWGGGPPIVLARLTASVEAPVMVGEPHALVSWELGRSGRKREAACVLFGPSGRVLARARALWIQLRMS